MKAIKKSGLLGAGIGLVAVAAAADVPRAGSAVFNGRWAGWRDNIAAIRRACEHVCRNAA